MSWLAIFRKADKRIIFVSLLLLACIFFAIIQMVRAWTDDDPVREYQNQPATAFAPPSTDVLAESEFLTSPRLPDPAFIELKEKTLELAQKFADSALFKSKLEEDGLKPPAAQQVMDSLGILDIPTKGRVDPDIVLNFADLDRAQTSASVVFGESNQVLQTTWARSGDSYVLTDLKVEAASF